MQPLTEQQTQRVWSRVMNAQAVPAAQMNEQTSSGSAAADSMRGEKLLELIRDERADSALYAHPACRMKGKAQAMAGGPPREAVRRGLFPQDRQKGLSRQAGCAVRHLHQRNAPPALFRGARRARGV